MTMPYLPPPGDDERERRLADLIAQNAFLGAGGRRPADPRRGPTRANRPAPPALTEDRLVGAPSWRDRLNALAEGAAQMAVESSPLGDLASIERGLTGGRAALAAAPARLRAMTPQQRLDQLALGVLLPTLTVPDWATDLGSGLVGLAGSVNPGAKAADAALDAGKATTRRRTRVSMRELDPEAAREAALADRHVVYGRDGKVVGAPTWVRSAEDLAALRARIDKAIEDGVQGGAWYDRAKAGNVEVAGPDVGKQRLLAQEEGLWSPQATPDVNLGALLQAHNAYESGNPRALVRTGEQARKYRAARDAGRDIKQGPKTGEFTNKLDPTVPDSHIPVNDIWQGRVFGYVDKDGKPVARAFTAQEHDFMDAETLLAAERANARQLGGKTDWNVASVQAAPWVYAKGVDLNKRFPKKYPTVEAGLAEAARTYVDYYPKYTAYATHEFVPGAGTGHLRGLVDADEATRARYSNDRRSSWAGADGRDVLYDAMGLYARPTTKATGAFTSQATGQLETNPARVARPLVGYDILDGTRQVSPESVEALNMGEAFRAYMDGQEAGAWHARMREGESGVPASALRNVMIPTSGPLQPAKMRELAELANAHGFGVSDTGEGVSLLNYNDLGGTGPVTDGRALTTLLEGKPATKSRAAIPGLGGQLKAYGTGPAERFTLQSGYLETGIMDDGQLPTPVGSGLATRRLLAAVGQNPTFMGKLDQSKAVRRRVAARAARDADVSKQLGLPVREDLQTARALYSREGFDGLRRALEAGIPLPD